MTLATAQDFLQAQVSTQQSLVLQTRLFPALDKLLYYLNVNRLVLRKVGAITLAEGQLSVSGLSDIFQLSGLPTILSFSGDDELLGFMEFDLPDAWHFQDSFPNLPPSAKEDPAHPGFAHLEESVLYDLSWQAQRLFVQTQSSADGVAGINFSGSSALPTYYAGLEGLLGLPSPLGFSGTILLRPGLFPLIRLFAQAQAAPFAIQGKIDITETKLEIRTQQGLDGEELSLVLIEGTILLGNTNAIPIHLSTPYKVDNQIFSFEATFDDNSLTVSNGINAILDLVEGEHAEFQLPAPLDIVDAFFLKAFAAKVHKKDEIVEYLSFTVGSTQHWPIIPGFLTVTDLRFAWLVNYPFSGAKYRYITTAIAGTLQLGTDPGIHFDVFAQSSRNFNVIGQLRPGESVNLTRVLQTALNTQVDLPELDLVGLEIEASTTGEYRLMGVFTSDLSFNISSSSQLKITELDFDLQKYTNSERAFLYGAIQIADVKLYVQTLIEKNQGGTTGALFQGGTLPGSAAIHLPALINWLLDFLGTSLPSQVPDIQLKNLGISYDTASKAFSFQGETLVPINVPFFDEAHANAQVHSSLAIISEISLETGKRTFQGFMEADLTIGRAIFILKYEVGKANHVFDAEWKSTDYEAIKQSLRQGNNVNTADFATFGFHDLLEVLGITAVPDIPAGVDLGLIRATLQYTVETESLLLSAESANYGNAFFIATKGGVAGDANAGAATVGNWKYVFGLEFNLNKIGEIPGFGELSDFSFGDTFHFSKLGILISSTSIERFQFPEIMDLPSINQDPNSPRPRGQLNHVGAGSTIKLHSPFNVIGEIDFERTGANHPEISNLGKTTGQNVLVLTVAVDSAQESLDFAAFLQGSAGLDTGNGSRLDLANPFIQLNIDRLGLSLILGSIIDLTITKHIFEVDLGLAINLAEAQAFEDIRSERDDGGTLKPASVIEAPFGIKGLFIDSLGMEMGVIFEPPGMDMGVQGSFHIGDNGEEPVGADRFAMVMEIVDIIPNPVLLSFYLETLSFAEIFEVFTDRDEAPFDFLNDVSIHDLAFYWAENKVILPDKSIAQPGFAFSGTLNILDAFELHAGLSISPISGVSGEAEMSPIFIEHIVSITGNGAGVSILMEPNPDAPTISLPAGTKLNDNGLWRDSNHLWRDETGVAWRRTRKQVVSMELQPGIPAIPVPDNVDLSRSRFWKDGAGRWRDADGNAYQPSAGSGAQSGGKRLQIVPPGGPIVQFNSTHEPYFLVSLHVSLFDAVNVELDADLTNDGLRFKLELDVTDIVTAELDVTINKDGFAAHTKFGLHLKADIGPIVIAGHDFGTIHLDTGFDLEMSLSINTSSGFSLKINGDFEFEGDVLTLPELELTIAPSSLRELPELLLKHIAEFAGTIFKFLLDLAIALVEAGEKEAFALTEAGVHEVAQLGQEGLDEAEKIEQSVVHAIDKGADQLQNEINTLAGEADQILDKAQQKADEIASVFGDQAVAIEREVFKVAKEAVEVVSKIASAIVQEGKIIIDTIGRLATEAIEEAKVILAAAERAVEAILHVAEKVVTSILETAKTVVHALEKEAERIWNAISDFLSNVGKGIVHAAKSVWHAISKY